MKGFFKGVALALLTIVGTVSFPTVNSSKKVKASEGETGSDSSKETITIVAASDFQNMENQEAGKEEVEAILENMKKDLPEDGIDAFFFCGDYDAYTFYDYDATVKGMNLLKEAVSDLTPAQTVLLKGNHDAEVPGLSKSGNNDPDSGEYGVFVIHESDYQWMGKETETTKQTAQNLIDYLNEKIEEKYEEPIFILSHLALAYSMRTYNDGDGKDANYLFDAINAAGEKGLNIVYMYGHDHSNGWDDYLGGPAVYLPKGDEILIAQNSQTTFARRTLNFTYMNAGFVGYFVSPNIPNDEGDEYGLNKLTMSKFEIADGEITVTRYTKDGTYNMKNAGVRNEDKNETEYDPVPTVYPSPAKISLTKVVDVMPVDNLIPKKTDVNVEKYVQVTDVSQIRSGKEYLLVHSASQTAVLPQVVTRENAGTSLVGLDLGALENYYDDVIVGLQRDAHWTVESADEGFYFKNGNKYLSVKNEADKGITVALGNAKSLFALERLNDGTFIFSSGGYVLKYNQDCNIAYGYSSGASAFALYEYVEGVYTVNFIDYDGTLISTGRYAYDSYVKIPNTTPSRADEGNKSYTFSGWNKDVEIKVTKNATYIAQYKEGEAKPSQAKIDAFNGAVASVDACESMQEKHAAIFAAIKLYDGLNAPEKAAVEGTYQTLAQKIDAYNSKVDIITQECIFAVSNPTATAYLASYGSYIYESIVKGVAA